MDRQHPRDLFDVLGLYARDGLTPGVVECFVCYIAGHNRPVHEVLFANQLDIARSYVNEFVGMTRDPRFGGTSRRLRRNGPQACAKCQAPHVIQLKGPYDRV